MCYVQWMYKVMSGGKKRQHCYTVQIALDLGVFLDVLCKLMNEYKHFLTYSLLDKMSS